VVEQVNLVQEQPAYLRRRAGGGSGRESCCAHDRHHQQRRHCDLGDQRVQGRWPCRHGSTRQHTDEAGGRSWPASPYAGVVPPEGRSKLRATERLDEEKLEILRAWGDGLLNDGRDEVRAAGRAILLLIEEIERLNIDLWHAGRLGSAGDAAAAEAAAAEAAPPEERPEELRSTLRRRLGAFRYQTPGPPAE
jgi:hypothetical protein